jgi:hypothetical protein
MVTLKHSDFDRPRANDWVDGRTIRRIGCDNAVELSRETI